MRKAIIAIAGWFLFGAAAHICSAASVTNDIAWVDDLIPTGAIAGADGGDGWNWVSSPGPVSGTLSSQSSIASGLHQHYFYSASKTLPVNAGETLITYIFLDPLMPPSEVMLQWNDGTWEHRAYWGANQITYGTDTTAGRHYMGALPAIGKWVRLEVPASQVGLEGSTLHGMSFTLHDGRANWDMAGKSSVATTHSTGASSPSGGTNSTVPGSVPS